MPDKQTKLTERDDGVELETQVVLRMPSEPAQVLRETLREGGPNLKDRLTVKLENDLRYGEVRFDHWLMYTKLVDLPTVTESLKTIDGKNFYKTADICQMLMCKYEEPDAPTTDDESPTKNKKKDSNKVDKKFLWPHGVTPPCKNVRKRRFRKILRKKCVEAPEIEKEVKRLLRADNEAVQVKWDIVLEEEDPSKPNMMIGNDESTSQSAVAMDIAGTSELDKISKPDTGKAIEDSSDVIPRDIDIFGEDLSSSDDEDNNNINVDVDETSRLSGDDSRSNFSSSMPSGSMATEFNKQMFNRSPSRLRQTSDSMDLPHSPISASTSRPYYDNDHIEPDDNEFGMPQMCQDEIQGKIADLRRQLNDLCDQRIAKEQEISSIENETLRARMQDALDNILSQIIEREMELQDYQSMLF
ncbi:transcription initiation factor TFIID subunit 7-like [Contarinia nasturtii]|uniref:transcription initiation factor TFIID subunit 7-like n=1 Tax=Contarinia nasturtii TaxID=265458 RepID=UPI0012D40840|nr:transcription initiation factor TFIID subunit 7-like [Contarinia nasturtii]